MNERKTVRRQEELQDCIRGARNLLKEQKRKGVTSEYYQEQANKTTYKHICSRTSRPSGTYIRKDKEG